MAMWIHYTHARPVILLHQGEGWEASRDPDNPFKLWVQHRQQYHSY